MAKQIKTSRKGLVAPRVAILTSLPPKMSRIIGGIEYGETIKRACVESWKPSGYRVYSFNAKSEITALSQQNLSVSLIAGNGKETRVEIGQMLDFAKSQKLDFAIICNADCYLFDHEKLAQILRAMAPNDICALERLNFNEDSLRLTGKSCAGFDMFIIGADALQLVDTKSHWRIGDTWWDYWLPISIAQKGGRISTIAQPIIIHIDHKLNWNFQSWKANGIRFANSISASDTSIFDEKFRERLALIDAEDEGHITLSRLGDTVFSWLRNQPVLTLKDGDKSWADLKSLLFATNIGGPQTHLTTNDITGLSAAVLPISNSISREWKKYFFW